MAYELAGKLYNRMSDTHNRPLDLEEMKSLLEKLPDSYRKPVQALLANHIFTKQSFEIDRPTFCAVYAARHRPVAPDDPPKRKSKAVRVVIHLKDIVDLSFSSEEEVYQEPEPMKLSFSERLMMRINSQQSYEEQYSEGLNSINHQREIDQQDLVNSYYSKYSS